MPKKSNQSDKPNALKTKVDTMRHPAGRASLVISKLCANSREEAEALLFELTQSVTTEIHSLSQCDGTSARKILAAQALTLDMIFQRLIHSVTLLATEPELLLRQAQLIETLSAIAFRAQEQSRRSLVALEEMKNPKRSTTFIKNYVDKQLQMNMEQQNYADKRLDGGTETEATGTYQAMETLGEIHRG